MVMKVLLAVHDAPMSTEVINAVASRVWPKHTQVKILSVVEPIELANDSSELAATMSELRDVRTAHAAEFCHRVKTRLLAHDPTFLITYETRYGAPAIEILDLAEQWNADKIIVGAHSKANCTKNPLGPVSQRVALHAPCSVEIVRSHANKSAVGAPDMVMRG